MNNVYRINMYDKNYFIRRFQKIIINKKEYLFVGIIEKEDYIPNINCIYISNNKIIKRDIKNPNEFKFISYEPPRAKGRPRFRRFGKFVTTYSSPKDLEYEKEIKNSFIKRFKNKIDIYKNCPLEVEMKFYLPIPKSISKIRQKLLNGCNSIKKPDVDNLSKGVLDGLNTVAYRDDSLIFRITSEKLLSKTPRTEVILKYTKVKNG